MRAARYHGKEDIRIEEIPRPTCGPGQVKVEPAFVGICGTGELQVSHIHTSAPEYEHILTSSKISMNSWADQSKCAIP